VFPAMLFDAFYLIMTVTGGMGIEEVHNTWDRDIEEDTFVVYVP